MPPSFLYDKIYIPQDIDISAVIYYYILYASKDTVKVFLFRSFSIL